MQIISELIEAHIFRKSDEGIEFLLLKRAEGNVYPELWQMVTGKMKKDESAHKAALREIKEETNHAGCDKSQYYFNLMVPMILFRFRIAFLRPVAKRQIKNQKGYGSRHKKSSNQKIIE